MDTNKMRDISREQFEQRCPVPEGACWNAEQARYVLFHLKLCTVAMYERFVEHWVCWQASREAVVVELPKVVGFEGAYDSHRHHEFVSSMSDVEDADEIFGLCRRVEAMESIEAQGLKVAP